MHVQQVPFLHFLGLVFAVCVLLAPTPLFQGQMLQQHVLDVLLEDTILSLGLLQ
jgi:hypothetical protein